MAVKERIMQFIEDMGISAYEFEKKCGLSTGFVRKIVKTITIEKMEDILNAYPQINPGWLITGNGSMLLPQNDPEALFSEFMSYAHMKKEDGVRIIAPLFKDNSHMGDFVTDGSLKLERQTIEEDTDCPKDLEREIERLNSEILSNLR